MPGGMAAGRFQRSHYVELQSFGMGPRRILAYIWAAPTTAIGLFVAGLGVLTGGHTRVVTGVLEAHGGIVRWILQHCTLIRGGAAALTLGHVVLAQDRRCHDRSRSHERVHVRQCERWGPFFIPAYLLASLWILVRGGQPYRDNPFEREAYGLE